MSDPKPMSDDVTIANRTAVLSLVDLEHSFSQGERVIHVLDKASVDLFAGETVALVGPSGSGKSTFLHIVGLLEKPDRGKVLFDGRDTIVMDDHARTRIRRQDFGFIYQFHQLLPEFSALENIVIPQLLLGIPKKQCEQRAMELLEGMGLGNRAVHRPAELSGGEQQRVAIARSVANRPRLLLADEPTGNLDPATSDRVFDSLVKLVRETGLATLMATHNMELAKRMDRIIRLEAGKLIEVDGSDI